MKRLLFLLLTCTSAHAFASLDWRDVADQLKHDKKDFVLGFDMLRDVNRLSDEDLIFRHYLLQQFICKVESDAARKACAFIAETEVLQNQQIQDLSGFEQRPEYMTFVLKQLQILAKSSMLSLGPEGQEKAKDFLALIGTVTGRALKAPLNPADLNEAFSHSDVFIAELTQTPSLRPYLRFLELIRGWVIQRPTPHPWRLVYSGIVKGGEFGCAMSKLRNRVLCWRDGGDGTPLVAPAFGIQGGPGSAYTLRVHPKLEIVCSSQEANYDGEVMCFGKDLQPSVGFGKEQICRGSQKPWKNDFDLGDFEVSQKVQYFTQLQCPGQPRLILFGGGHEILGAYDAIPLRVKEDERVSKEMLAQPVKLAARTEAFAVGAGVCSLVGRKLTCSDPSGTSLNLVNFPRENVYQPRVLGSLVCVTREGGSFPYYCRNMKTLRNYEMPFGTLVMSLHPIAFYSTGDSKTVAFATADWKDSKNTKLRIGTLPGDISTQDLQVYWDERNEAAGPIICSIAQRKNVQCLRLEDGKDVPNPFNGLSSLERLLNVGGNLCALSKDSVWCLPFVAEFFQAIQLREARVVVSGKIPKFLLPNGRLDELRAVDNQICATDGNGFRCIEVNWYGAGVEDLKGVAYGSSRSFSPYETFTGWAAEREFCFNTDYSFQCLRPKGTGIYLEKK